MEEYVIKPAVSPTIRQDRFCKIVREKHECSYGVKGADIIQANCIRIFNSLMKQLYTNTNHNSLLVGKVQSATDGFTPNMSLFHGEESRKQGN